MPPDPLEMVVQFFLLGPPYGLKPQQLCDLFFEIINTNTNSSGQAFTKLSPQLNLGILAANLGFDKDNKKSHSSPTAPSIGTQWEGFRPGKAGIQVLQCIALSTRPGWVDRKKTNRS